MRRHILLIHYVLKSEHSNDWGIGEKICRFCIISLVIPPVLCRCLNIDPTSWQINCKKQGRQRE